MPEAVAFDPSWSTPGRVTWFLRLGCYEYIMKRISILALLTLTPFSVAVSAQAPVTESETEYVVSSPTPTTYKPSDRDIDEAIAAFDAFLNLRDVGKLSDAYAMLTEANREMTPRSDWEQMQRSAQQEFGADLSRQIFRISWYPNPPSADQKGLFIALDFASKTQKDGFRCGYVVLLKKDDLPMMVARTDDTNVPDALTDGPLPRSEIVSKLPCYLGKNITTTFSNARK